ncbi:MAG: hypothetical protein EOP05_00515 [Proteobacteria bacterium]|nr:MAG: hypothetical protein EOP05_00515 [Pseudomonadota bacterium]
MRFTVGNSNADHFSVDVLSYERSEITDFWDSNWLVCDITVQSSDRKLRIKNGNFTTVELKELRESLTALLNASISVFTVDPMEPFLQFSVNRKPEEITFEGVFNPTPMVGEQLSFKISTTPSEGLKIVTALQEITRCFPVRGEADISKDLKLADAILRETTIHEIGRFAELGQHFDEFESNSDASSEAYVLALNFWEAWIDERDHDFANFYGIEREAWPNIAVEVLKYLRSGEMPTHPNLIKFSKTERLNSASRMKRKLILLGTILLLAAICVAATFFI